MANTENHTAFVTAFNDFDSRPLSGERLKKFYTDDFAKDSVNQMITTIRITERFKKMLIIGHRGCGKSTILNKVAEELQNDYHVVIFSAADVINMGDVEPVDILLGTYVQVLQSVAKQRWFDSLLNPFKKLIDPLKKLIKFSPEEVNLLGVLALKFKTEKESRDTMRQSLRNQMDMLQTNLSAACNRIQQEKQQDVLIFIDDLDKLELEFAERVFYRNPDLLILPEVKIVYTFPLDTYYRPDIIRIQNHYADQFISVINLQTPDGTYLPASQQAFKKLILRRIAPELVNEAALNYIIKMSGGLLRDLVKFMQDACNFALVNNLAIIDQATAEKAVNKLVIHYYKVFDFPKYAESVKIIADTPKKIDNDTLVFLLRYLFVLEYRQIDKVLPWYDVHPCLTKAIEEQR